MTGEEGTKNEVDKEMDLSEFFWIYGDYWWIKGGLRGM